MTNALLKYFLVFASTLVLLRLFARLATRVGLVDRPGRRKRHKGEIPLIGGPAIFAGLAFGALLIADTLYPYRALFAGLAVLLVAGLLDDVNDLTPRQKFIAQLTAALCMVSWGGMIVTGVGDLFGFGPMLLRGWAVPFTVICLLGLINATNMSDGADGLAGGVSLIALVLLALSALVVGRIVSAQLLMTTVAVVLAFWAMNMRFPWQPHARVFMGDSGSMMLGLLLTWFSVELARGQNGLAPMAAVWFLAVPLLDMGVVIARRLGKRQSPFRARRDHFHHVLIAAGISPSTAVLTILALGLALGAGGFFAWRAGIPEHWMFYSFLALFIVCYLISFRWWRIVRAIRRRLR
ncbi:MAG: MraY family glycosyltransferase [Burkholderiales bacterium]